MKGKKTDWKVHWKNKKIEKKKHYTRGYDILLHGVVVTNELILAGLLLHATYYWINAGFTR